MMVARRFFVCAAGVMLLAFLCWVAPSRSLAADRPNRATQPDQAVGQMVDSLFEFEKQPAPRVQSQPRSRTRRFASRTTSLQGKLVRNPDQNDGTPPFALIDRYGGVLRYIEPVSHIDLQPYLGKTVGVRRDTGDTLLASQLALNPVRTSSYSGGVQLANFEETIAPGEVVESPVVMHGGGEYLPGGHEPIYLDDGLNFGGCPDCGSYVGCGSYCRSRRRRCHGGYFGYQLTMLRPFVSGAIGFLPAGTPATFEDKVGFGHRFTLGYDGGHGLGARIRYWFYNHGHGFTIPVAAAADYNSSLNLDMDVADLEFTLDERLKNWEMILAGGFRYGRIGLREPELIGNSQMYFEGAGPTVALEAIRACGPYGFYLVGNFRASLLLGDWYNYMVIREFDNNGNDTYRIQDEAFTVLENQLGIGYTRRMQRASLTFRTVWETQFWLNDLLSDAITGLGTNVAFSGPTVSAELRF